MKSMKPMKRIFIALAVSAAVMLSACSSQKTELPTVPQSAQATKTAQTTAPQEIMRSEKIYDYVTFEEALALNATDVVVANYVSHAPFGEEQTLMEYEFAVKERILGNAADRIFVYSENPENTFSEAFVENADKMVMFNPGDLSFDTETDYLLALEKIDNPLVSTQSEGFTFINNIVIDLDSPLNSTMYSEALNRHTEELLLSADTPVDEIISYVEELTEDNTPSADTPELNKTKDIIKNAPNIFIVEVGELLGAPRTDWIESDNYYVTVTRTLKGTPPSEDEIILTFPADAAEQGETYIVAAEPIEEGYDDWFRLTSFNSLFTPEQLDEITALIN